MSIKNDVIELWKRGYTSDEILEVLPYSRKQINSVYTRWGIHANRYSIIEDDNNLQQFIIGGLLGDASMVKISGLAKHSKISIAHSLKHREYTEFKFNFLAKYKLAPSKISYNKIYNTRYKKGYFEEARFKSKSHPYFDRYRELFYPNGTKIIPNIIKKLDSFGLAIWFMDDGNVTNDGYNIATNCFNINDLHKLQLMLKENFDLSTSLQKCVGALKIYIGKAEQAKFQNIVEPHIIPLMKYKLFPYKLRVLNKSDKLLGNPEKDNQQPSL